MLQRKRDTAAGGGMSCLVAGRAARRRVWLKRGSSTAGLCRGRSGQRLRALMQEQQAGGSRPLFHDGACAGDVSRGVSLCGFLPTRPRCSCGNRKPIERCNMPTAARCRRQRQSTCDVRLITLRNRRWIGNSVVHRFDCRRPIVSSRLVVATFFSQSGTPPGCCIGH